MVYTPVTPNHLTTARLISGLAAATVWAFGLNLGGAILFAVSILLDRADGELARQQGSASSFGHRYDIVTDAVSNAAVMIGIGYGLREGPLGAWALGAGIIAGLAIAYVLLAMVRREREAGEGAAAFAAVGGFDADDAMLVIPVGMALGLGNPLIVAAAIGAPAAALIITVKFRRRR